MPNRRSTGQNRSGWNANNQDLSPGEISREQSDAETTDFSDEIDVSSQGSTDEQTIPDELVGYFAADYYDVKRVTHISGAPEFVAIKKAFNRPVRLYIVPYTEEELIRLKGLSQEAFKCPYLLNFTRIEVKSDWILLEVTKWKSMLEILDELNPDMGLIKDARREDWDENTMKAMLHDVLQALQFIHKLGYVHTAVRAASMCINKDGRVLLGNLQMMRRRNELSFTTPYAHMAPEMIVRLPGLKFPTKLRAGLSEGFSTKSDIWSLGMFLIELIYLMDIDEYFERTEKGLTDQQLAEKILTTQPWAPNAFQIYSPKSKASLDHAFEVKYSPFLDDFYYRCTDRDQDARWSAEKLLKVHKFMNVTHKPGLAKIDQRSGRKETRSASKRDANH